MQKYKYLAATILSLTLFLLPASNGLAQQNKQEKSGGFNLLKALDRLIFGGEKKIKPKIDRETTGADTEQFQIPVRLIRELEEIKDPGLDKDIENSIRKAIKNSPIVKQALLQYIQVRKENSFIPTPKFNIGHDVITGNNYVVAEISIPLDPIWTGKEKAKLALSKLRETKMFIRTQVITAYQNIINAYQKLQKIRKKVLSYRELLKATEIKYSHGQVEIKDLVAVRSALTSAEIMLVEATNEYEKEKLRLQMIVNGVSYGLPSL